MDNSILSREEIDALLRGTPESNAKPETPHIDELLNEMEKDTLGEIANISMGTAATTLSQLLGKKVNITTPKVELTSSEQIRKDFPIPSVICNVKYIAGIEGSNLFILSQRDGSVIVDLMMGGEGNQTTELTELQISGIAESMNQMMGSAATSMSTVFNSKVDITPPNIMLTDFSMDEDIISNFLNADEPLVRISFRMVVKDVLDSILIQVLPLNVAKGMVNKLMGAMAGGSAAAPAAQAPVEAQASVEVQATVEAQATPEPASFQEPSLSSPPAYQASPYQTSAGFPLAGAVQVSQGRTQTSVQPARFAPLQPGQPTVQPDNLDLILDLPLQISVELGRAKKTIKEILEMGPGSVIELERMAGEAVDMIVNGKLIAKCEVVVINETFGIRITDIVNPMERVNSLK